MHIPKQMIPEKCEIFVNNRFFREPFYRGIYRPSLGVSGTIPRSGGNVNGRSSRFMRNVRPAVLRKINVCRRPAAKEPENSLKEGNFQAFHRKSTQKWMVCITD
jgi:hypothetical protein